MSARLPPLWPVPPGGAPETRADAAPAAPAPVAAEGFRLPPDLPSGLPRPLQPFLHFAALLRNAGFAVAPEQMQGLIAAVGLLGPRSIEQIFAAAEALIGPAPERREEFAALFRLAFMGQTVAAPVAGEPEDEDELQAFDDRGGDMEPPEIEEEESSGGTPSGAERLFARGFGQMEESEALRRFRRAAPRALPRRRARRLAPASGRGQFDLRRALREAARRDGELLSLPARRPRLRRRRVLLLIDVSGSMKEHTDTYLRFAHALAQAEGRLECFTLGTRLTRVSRALKRRNREQALARAGQLVADWDGGTRLGDALGAFLAVPRFAGFARGALVVVLSDGLERGDPAAMIEAVAKLSRLAWAILWLSPLAGSRDYRPETAALQGILPHLARLGDGSSAQRLCAEVLGFEKEARQPAAMRATAQAARWGAAP